MEFEYWIEVHCQKLCHLPIYDDEQDGCAMYTIFRGEIVLFSSTFVVCETSDWLDDVFMEDFSSD